MSVGIAAVLLTVAVVFGIAMVVRAGECADRDAVEHRLLMAKDQRVCDLREKRRRMARSAVEDWRES